MKEIKKFPHGTFSWVDLMTPDREKAKEFYNKLFGWESEDLPAGNNMTYTMFRMEGMNISGAGDQTPDDVEKGFPAYWCSYVTVDDINETVEKVKAEGGEIELEPMDVMDAGKMAVIKDPTGAVFMIWQAVNHQGADVVNKLNCFSWNELSTDDIESATKFYKSVFGWDFKKDDNNYYTIINKGRMNGGIMEKPEGMNVPNAWMVYFTVENLEESINTTKENGGSIMFGPKEIEQGKIAVALDPSGAAFYMIEMGMDPEEVPNEWCE